MTPELNRTAALFLVVGFIATATTACLAFYYEGPPSPKAPEVRAMREMIQHLEPLHARLGKPTPGDWLDRHKEPGQTFAQYLSCAPNLPGVRRRYLYVQPIGHMDPLRKGIVDKTAEFLRRYFQIEVKLNDPVPLSLIPKSKRRSPGRGFGEQLLSTYVLHKVLRPRLPDDAIAYLGITAHDLWPGRGWNFVFGQASLHGRVGVWSIARNGDPGLGGHDYRQCLLRTLKTASHETGHMFSIKHCTAWECNMCGSNSRRESDRRTVALCPECSAKVCWGMKAEPNKRINSLLEFCEREKLAPEATFYRRVLARLKVPMTRLK